VSRAALEQLEAAGLDPRSPELLVSLAWLTLPHVAVDDAELKASRRRAVLVAAAGGDPHRDLDADSVAVLRLADELDTPPRRAALGEALAGLDAGGLPTVASAVELLRSEPELAWRMFALAHVADELAED
jgi:hypothetical protein